MEEVNYYFGNRVARLVQYTTDETNGTTMIALEDAEKLNKENPSTFPIPPLEIRENLKVGDTAKLIFTGGKYAERMWVRITQLATGCLPIKSYIGELASNPISIEYQRIADGPIQFDAKHIIDVWTQPID